MTSLCSHVAGRFGIVNMPGQRLCDANGATTAAVRRLNLICRNQPITAMAASRSATNSRTCSLPYAHSSTDPQTSKLHTALQRPVDFPFVPDISAAAETLLGLELKDVETLQRSHLTTTLYSPTLYLVDGVEASQLRRCLYLYASLNALSFGMSYSYFVKDLRARYSTFSDLGTLGNTTATCYVSCDSR